MSTGYVWAGYVWADYVWADGVWAGQQSSNLTEWVPVTPPGATAWGVASRSSTWNKFNTLRPLSLSTDVDFVYRASEHDPVIANSIIPVCITEKSEQP